MPFRSRNLFMTSKKPGEAYSVAYLLSYGSSCRESSCPTVRAEFQQSLSASDLGTILTVYSGLNLQASFWQLFRAMEAQGADMASINQASDAFSLFGQAMLSLLIGFCLWQGRTMVKYAPAPRQIRRATEWIADHLDQDIYLDDVARYAGVSVRNLQVCFKRQFGYGPVAYINEMRLRRAHDDLRSANADVTIAEIARRWKFSRPGDFATRYKALFGRYPSETRRSWQTEKNLLKVEESRQPPLCAIAE